MEAVRFPGQDGESFVQVIQSPKQDRGIGLKESQGRPLQDEVQIGDEPFKVSFGVGGQCLDGLQVLLEIVVKHLPHHGPARY